jgi:hypothetical protein
MRYEEVKKRLWSEGIIVAVAMTILAGGSYYLMTMADESERQNKQLENQVNTIVAAMNTLRDKYNTVQKNAELYQEVLQKSNNDKLSVNRDLLRKKFLQYRVRYYLSGLSANMQPAQEMNDPKYKRHTTVMVNSEVKATFFALTDEDVYNLMKSLQQEFSGVIKVTQCTLVRKGKPTDTALAAISQSGEAQLVDANINFNWLGIKPVENTSLNDINAIGVRP